MLRWAFLIVVIVGVIGIARVLLFAAASSPGEEWMRWTPSVDLATLADGETRRMEWNGRPWFLRAVGPDERAAAGAADPATLRQSESVESRLLRVEIGLATRWFAALAGRTAEGCEVREARGGWNDTCGGGYDVTGRALKESVAKENLARPDYVVRRGVFHLHPDQMGEG